MSFGRNLQALRQGAGLTQDQVAEAFGISRAAVIAWEKNKNFPEAEKLQRLADLLGCSVNDFYGPRAMEDSTKGAAYVVRPARVVFRGIAQVREGGYFALVEPDVNAPEQFALWPSNDPQAYALQVDGDALRPEIEPGSVLIIEPARQAEPGRRVLVSLMDGRQLVRRLNWIRGNRVELGPIGAGAPITVNLADIATLARIVGVADDDVLTTEH